MDFLTGSISLIATLSSDEGECLDDFVDVNKRKFEGQGDSDTEY
jgi:hypothetical protein